MLPFLLEVLRPEVLLLLLEVPPLPEVPLLSPRRRLPRTRRYVLIFLLLQLVLF